MKKVHARERIAQSGRSYTCQLRKGANQALRAAKTKTKNTMKTSVQIRPILFLASMTFALLWSASSVRAGSLIIPVSGTIAENPLEENVTPNGISYTALDTFTGTLAGTGLAHIFSSQFTGGAVTDIISKNAIFTDAGNLFLEGVGTLTGNAVSASLTVTVGTGRYMNATGELLFQGTILADGTVAFTYTGLLSLPD